MLPDFFAREILSLRIKSYGRQLPESHMYLTYYNVDSVLLTVTIRISQKPPRQMTLSLLASVVNLTHEDTSN